MSASKSFSLLGKSLNLTTADDIKPHLDELKALGPLSDIAEIHLGGNTLGVGACEALAAVIKELEGLKVADFADIFTGRLITEIPQSLSSISDALLSCPILEEVNFSDNAFGGRSAQPMVPLLSAHPTLSILRLANNGLGPTGGNIIAQALLDLGEKAKNEGRESKLRVVVCGRNRLENGSAGLWGKAFSTHRGLEEVRLYQNGIRMEGASEIVKGLRGCKGFRILDLCDNVTTMRSEDGKPARSTGTRAIADSLRYWPNLQELQLSDCLLNVAFGGVLLARKLALGNNKTLEVLRLKGDEMEVKAVTELAKAIEVGLPGLKTLELNENYGESEDECYEAVRKALKVHGCEEALDELDEMEEYDEEELGEQGDFDSGDEDADGLVEAAENAEAAEPAGAPATSEDDDLAKRMAGVKI